MPHRPVFTLHLSTALHRPVGYPSAFATRDEARAAVRYAFTEALWGLGDAPHYATISHPDGTRESLEFGRARLADPEARRAKLLRFVKLYDEAHGHLHRFRLRLGDAVVRWECLTDAALEDVASDMVRDFWWQKKSVRENRSLCAGGSGPPHGRGSLMRAPTPARSDIPAYHRNDVTAPSFVIVTATTIIRSWSSSGGEAHARNILAELAERGEVVEHVWINPGPDFGADASSISPPFQQAAE